MDFTKTDGILFDLDGTLWDSRDGVLKAWNEVISLHPEAERGPLTKEEILPCFGLPMNEIRDRLLKDAAPEARERVMEAMCAHENEYLLAHGGILFPDLEDTLAYLAARFPLFIVSNCQDGYIQAFLGAHRLGKYFKDQISEGKIDKDIVVVSPDLGSVTRARTFSNILDCPIAIVDKRRPKPNVSEIMNIIGDIKDKTAILVDDMVDTAGTITNAANALIDLGAKEVYACATHPVLSGPAFKRIEESAIKEMVLLNTIPLPENVPSSKIKMLSVAPMFAEAMKRVFTNESLSMLFTE